MTPRNSFWVDVTFIFLASAFGYAAYRTLAPVQAQSIPKPLMLPSSCVLVKPDPTYTVMDWGDYQKAVLANAGAKKAAFGSAMSPTPPSTKLPPGNLYYVDAAGELELVKVDPRVVVDDAKDPSNPVVKPK